MRSVVINNQEDSWFVVMGVALFSGMYLCEVRSAGAGTHVCTAYNCALHTQPIGCLSSLLNLKPKHVVRMA